MTKREYPDLHFILAKNVSNARRTIGYSQQQLAEKADLSTNFVAQIEQGRKYPSAAVIERLALCLGIKPYMLFYDDPPEATIDRDQAVKLGQWLAKSLTKSIAGIVDQYIGEVGKSSEPTDTD